MARSASSSPKCPVPSASGSTPRATSSLARFELPVSEGVEYLNRTHPAVEAVATHVMDTALDSRVEGVARRPGRDSHGPGPAAHDLLLVRFRYHIITRKGDDRDIALLAEDCQILAFAGSPQNAEWLDDDQAGALLDADPEANVPARAGRRLRSQSGRGLRPDRPAPERRGKAARRRAAQSSPPRSPGFAPQGS